MLGLVVALVSRLDFFSHEVSVWLPYPYFRAGSEGLMLSEIAMVRAGHSIYVPLRPDQFISAPYPPLYYYLVAWLWPHTGSSPAESAAIGFQTGRIVSLVAAFLAALGSGLLAVFSSYRSGEMSATLTGSPKLGRLGWQVLTGMAGGCLFLSLPAVAVWAARVRADMLMTALQMLGLVLVAWKPRSWGAWLAIVPFTLAVYTKQTALAGPVAATVWLALQNWPNWKRTVSWIGGLAAASLLPFLWINLATGGEFWRRLFKYHNLGWEATNFAKYFGLFVQENTALLIASGLLLVWTIAGIWLEVRSAKTSWLHAAQQIPLSLLYLFFSLPILLGLGVAGADHNHFLPAEAATCATAATLLGWSLTRQTNNWYLWLVLPVLGLLIWQAAVFSVPDQRYEIEFRIHKPDEAVQLSKIIKMATTNPQPLLTSEAGFFPLTGKTPNYDDLFTLEALAQQGLYDQQGLLERIQHKEFGLVLAEGNLFKNGGRSDVWTPELLAVLKANYQLKYADVWFSYVPKP